jgi:aspartyl-tRNA(Asn)/glutamyl-tRNA(Gln) amidotransferase subunit C
MTLDKNTIEKIAYLSRLQIDDRDIPRYTQNLSNILEFIGQMNDVDTTEVVPMAHPLAVTQRLRDDQVTEVNQRDKFQAIAPQVESGLYLVPKVIE